MTKLALAATLAMALSVAAISAASAKAPDVQIVTLQCDSDPELVVIENLGDAAQDFTGWELVSDPQRPADVEVFDLSDVGSLQPGASITVQSGPAASGVFTWGNGSFIFRDDDPTDYARIVDDTGAVVHEVACAAAPEPTATATATATVAPTATAEPSPDNVPNGGGLPPPPAPALSPSLIIAVGSSLIAAGAATLTLPLRLLHSPSEGPFGRAADSATPRRRRPPAPVGSRENALFALALLGLAALAFFLLLWQRRA